MAQIARMNGKNNPKNINPEYLSTFEYSVIKRRTQQRAECCQGKCYNRKY